jgi:membrane protein DedA with SNARE-associated domain
MDRNRTGGTSLRFVLVGMIVAPGAPGWPLPTSALSFSEILIELGYFGVAMLMFVETIFPPIPSEAVLPLAGYFAEQGEFSLLLVVLVATIGSVSGAVLLYEAARRGGRPFAEAFLRRGRVDPARLDQAEQWFTRRGPIVVLAARCVPGVRSVISLPAGVLRMPRGQYLLFTTLGSLLWNFLLVWAGYLLGTRWEEVGDLLGPISKPALVVVVLGVVGFAGWRWWLARRRGSGETT